MDQLFACMRNPLRSGELSGGRNCPGEDVLYVAALPALGRSNQLLRPRSDDPVFRLQWRVGVRRFLWRWLLALGLYNSDRSFLRPSTRWGNGFGYPAVQRRKREHVSGFF